MFVLIYSFLTLSFLKVKMQQTGVNDQLDVFSNQFSYVFHNKLVLPHCRQGADGWVFTDLPPEVCS